MDYKTCNRCNNSFPATSEYFYVNDKNKKDGLYPYCKSCAIKKAKVRNIEFSEDIKDKSQIKRYKNRGIKPPFSYMGNKYYMFSEIYKCLPDKINTFVDVMCGSGMVGSNITANKIILNDIDKNMIECLREMYLVDNFVKRTKEIRITCLDEYKNGIIEFNKAKDIILFYVLVQYAYNQSPQYNKSGLFNAPYMNNKCYLNNYLLKRINDFSKMIKEKDIEFTNNDYKYFYDYHFKENDFVFIDPPYTGTCASYNFKWGDNDDKELCLFLDYLDGVGVKFMMINSGNNKIICEWGEKYNMMVVGKSKYKTTNKNGTDSFEIMIRNY